MVTFGTMSALDGLYKAKASVLVLGLDLSFEQNLTLTLTLTMAVRRGMRRERPDTRHEETKSNVVSY